MNTDRKIRILEFINSKEYNPLTANELAAVIDVPKSDMNEFNSILDELLNEGKILIGKKKRIRSSEADGLIPGTYSGNERGFGFVRFDSEKEDLFIPPDASNTALDGDTVLVSEKTGRDGRPEGKVEKVLAHANKFVVGMFQAGRNSGFVIPDDSKISKDIYISKKNFFGARDGQEVVCEITSYPLKAKNPEGRIIEVIGYSGEHDTVIKTVLKRYNINSEFSEAVISEAEKCEKQPIDLSDRLDLRRDTIITIDGEDSKDLDDAVSVKKIKGGIYRLGVHIADVSNYVNIGSELDKEAYTRGTSVYLVDRVIPMLPKNLSNGICSLQPKTDRLTLSCIMDIDKHGVVRDYKIAKSVIRSKERMTYRGVTDILEGRSQEYPRLHRMLKTMLELAVILRNRRKAEGSLDFDFPEAKIKLDEKGKPISIEKYEITISNHIIEEFMLAANRTVAEHMFWLNKPMMYRVHEKPDEDKLMNFAKTAYNLGYTVHGLNSPHPKELQKILDECKDKPEERVLSTLMLRSMMKAKYSENNLGHFGLNAKYYCHFTSPIRRYPDLVVHRLLKEWLETGITAESEKRWNKFMPSAAENCSITERNAEEAERDVDDIKKAEYMQQFIGEKFDGYISGVTGFGIFVELENTVEGLVHITALKDDYYVYDEKSLTLTGEHNKFVYRLGDKVSVVCVGADPRARQIDFELAVDSDE